MANAGIGSRLAKAGVREAADAYKEEIRRRLKYEGADRDTANHQAWDDMWDAYRPIVERFEAEKAKAAADMKAVQDEARDARKEAPPEMPQAPQAGGSPMMQQAAAAQMPGTMGPALSDLMGQYHQGQAGLQNQFQGAQAQAGLGWGGLADQFRRLQQQGQVGQQGNLLAMLGAMGGAMA